MILIYLHDLVENGRATEAEIAEYFGAQAARDVDALTLDKDRNYHEQVREIRDIVQIIGKLTDNLANISDDPTPKQKSKCIGSIAILTNALYRFKSFV